MTEPVEPRRRAGRRHPEVTGVELIGGIEKRPLFLVEHDPAWADRYREHQARLRRALGRAAESVEHIGSTAVPGLAAKPIIDILVTVRDITAEEDYLEPLIDAGYLLRVREPGHRMVRTGQREVQVHILEVDDPAAADYLLLRDRLRADPADRRLYEATKRELTAREWPDMNAYADAKTAVIEQIKGRARQAQLSHQVHGLHEDFEVTMDLGRIDLDLVHRWLSTDAFWAQGRSRETVALAARNSLNVGVLDRAGELRGYARVVTDHATFAWVCDVYVDPAVRGRGVGVLLARSIVENLRPMHLKRIVLSTLDAHGVYEKVGFVPLPDSERWMLLDGSGE